MLNTSSLKKPQKDNMIEYGGIPKEKETTLQEGIRIIEEQTNDNEEVIINSFHTKEPQIFKSIDDKNNYSDQQQNLIGNFNFNDITKKYSDSDFYKNKLDENQLMITINEKINKISVYEKSGKLIGYFTLEHIIKYLCDIYDKKKQFMKDLDEKVYDNSKDLIKILIFKLKYNKEINYADIVLLNYTQSGFMGDIELLIKLNNMLTIYLETKMNNDLSKVDGHDREKMELNIKKFVFLLLNYTLKLISYTSDQIKDKPNMNETRKYLFEYSIDVVYKINLFVQEQLKIINKQNKSIKESLEINIEIKNNIKSKLQLLVEDIKPVTRPPPNKVIMHQQSIPIPLKYQNLRRTPNLYTFNEQ